MLDDAGAAACAGTSEAGGVAAGAWPAKGAGASGDTLARVTWPLGSAHIARWKAGRAKTGPPTRLGSKRVSGPVAADLF